MLTTVSAAMPEEEEIAVIANLGDAVEEVVVDNGCCKQLSQ